MNKHSGNPYRSPSLTTEPQEFEEGKRLGRLGTLLIAVVIACGIAVIVGEALSIFVLMPPMNRWFGMRGEFSGLIVIGMPMWVGGCSLITAITLGALFPRNYSPAIAIAVGALVVAGCCWAFFGNPTRASDRHFTLTSSVILLVSTTSGVVAASKGLARINHIRAKPSPDETTRRKTKIRSRIVLISLTTVWGFLDAVALTMIFQDPDNFWLFLLSLCGFIFALGVMVVCAYQSVARSESRIIARLCLTATTVSLAVTLYLWLRIVWF